MNAAIISIGNELLTGQCVDTNSAWLSAELGRQGVPVVCHITVGDDEDGIAKAITDAHGQAELVVITGGLGPTPDDLTRQGLARAIAQPLEENADALEQIREMFERWQRPLSESNKIQALIPRGCDVIANPRGTAPGIRYVWQDRLIFALPGVPAEMRVMFEAAIVPALAATGGDKFIQTRNLRCFGMSEAKLGEILADLMAVDRNPRVGTTASQGIITVRIVAHGRSEAEAIQLAEADAVEVRRRLGSVVFGEGETTLAEVVAELLVGLHQTVATAESCTGGLLAKQLTDVSGSSGYFLRGYITYSNEAKVSQLSVSPDLIERDGAVSESVARAMALGCRDAAGTDIALSTTGIAGPTGGSPPEKPVGLVYLGLADSAGVEVRRVLFGEHLARPDIRDRSSKAALNMLRRRLLESPPG